MTLLSKPVSTEKLKNSFVAPPVNVNNRKAGKCISSNLNNINSIGPNHDGTSSYYENLSTITGIVKKLEKRNCLSLISQKIRL